MTRCVWRLALTLLALWFVAGTPAFAWPQDSVEHELDEAKALYRTGQLEEAVAALRAVIPKLNGLQDLQRKRIQLAEAHFQLGLSHLAMRDEALALENFRQVVAFDPGRTLDPDIYSPKTVALFERARSDLAMVPAEDRSDARPAVREQKTMEMTPTATGLSGTAVQIQPGTKVRMSVTGASGGVEGTLLASSDRALTVVDEENQTLSFPRNTVTKLEVLRGRRGHWLAGAVVGTLLGAIIGAVETPGCAGNDGDCYTRGENIGYGSLGFGLVGSLVGALIRTDQWAEMPVDRHAHAGNPADDRRFALAFTWRY
jgi:hypothetical protein